MPVESFSAVLVHTDGEAVVAVKGELDAATADVLWAVVDEALAKSPHVVLDVTNLTFVDSTGLAVFIRTYNRALEHSGSLTLRSPTAPVADVLGITGLDRVFTVQHPPAESYQT